MCQNVIKNATARLPWVKKADFNIRLTLARAKKRQTLWVAQDGKCHYCQCETVLPKQGAVKQSGAIATLDHIVTQENGGTDHLTNLVVACHSCNNKRSNMDYQTFYSLMTTPGGWEGHMKKVRAEKNARDEARREAGAERHRQHIAQQRHNAVLNKLGRQNVRNGMDPVSAFRQAAEKLQLPVELADKFSASMLVGMETTIQREAARRRAERIRNQCGIDGINLVRGFLHRANFNPRKDGKGTVLVLDIHPWEHYRGDVPTEDYPSMEMAA